ncbi:unnamed protein product [Brassica oleracea var. botrytis]
MAPSGSTYKESLESNWIGLAYEVRMSPLEKSVQARAMTIIKSICIVVALSTTVNVNSNPQEVENATWMLTVFNFFGRQFCLHFEAFQLGTAPVYMAFLRFMGDENEAQKFSYGLEVGAHSRKLTWQGIPRSIRDGHRKVRDSHDGLIIPRNMALFFSGSDKEERKLRVTGRIWREE